MWVVQTDGETVHGVYEAWMLRAESVADGMILTAEQEAPNGDPLLDMPDAETGEWPDDAPEDEVTEWRNVRGVRVARARRWVRDATLYRQHGDRQEWEACMVRASSYRRAALHASAILGTLS
jgi:hypothetical protein